MQIRVLKIQIRIHLAILIALLSKKETTTNNSVPKFHKNVLTFSLRLISVMRSGAAPILVAPAATPASPPVPTVKKIHICHLIIKI